MSAGIGECLTGMTSLLQNEQPDILVLLGDCGEMLAGAIAALHLGIVCVHIHGGERSGTVDEPVRHAISKLSHYHLAATTGSKDRFVRMGELPGAVYVTGAPGLDGLVANAAMPIDDLNKLLHLPLNQPIVLAVFHPVVQQAEDAYAQTSNLLLALSKACLPVMWLEPNCDAGSNNILKALADVGLPAGFSRLQHVQRDVFAAAMKHCAVMVGNSSAGIIKAASFSTPVVNVGDRHRFRERSTNVVDVSTGADAIEGGIANALKLGKVPCDNRDDDGIAGPRIVSLLTTLTLDRFVLNKSNSY